MIGTTIRECFKFQICSEFKSLGARKCTGERLARRSGAQHSIFRALWNISRGFRFEVQTLNSRNRRNSPEPLSADVRAFAEHFSVDEA